MISPPDGGAIDIWKIIFGTIFIIGMPCKKNHPLTNPMVKG